MAAFTVATDAPGLAPKGSVVAYLPGSAVYPGPMQGSGEKYVLNPAKVEPIFENGCAQAADGWYEWSWLHGCQA
jgi:hypothetical protein